MLNSLVLLTAVLPAGFCSLVGEATIAMSTNNNSDVVGAVINLSESETGAQRRSKGPGESLVKGSLA